MQQLIVLRGPIGAGKSSIMRELNKRVPTSSVIEIDAIKRMIGPDASSVWRRDAALKASYTLARALLEHGRSVITETHTRWPEQTDKFTAIAQEVTGTVFSSVLLYAPLDICLERAKSRHIADISYLIDNAMITAYHVGLEPAQDEFAIDTSRVSVVAAADQIILRLSPEEV